MSRFSMKKAILSLSFVLMLSISIFNTEASAAGGFSDVKSSDYFHDPVHGTGWTLCCTDRPGV